MITVRLSVIATIAAIAVLAFAVPARAQHPVLFETFTNSYDLCPAPNTYDQEFKSTLTSKGSKVIHLNHHVTNVGDPMVQAVSGSTVTVQRLSNTVGSNSTPVFVTAVDRAVFSSTGTRVTPTQSDWEDAIDAEAGKAPVASITLTNATMDKSVTQYITLHANVDVTALQDITDTLKIRYAVLQDNINYAQCSGTGPSTHNDVVRYITLGDSIVFVPGTSSGTVKHVVYNQKITTDARYKPADMKLIAFVEEWSGGDYRVTNAAILKKDLDTLQAPARSVALVDTSIDNKIYHPGDVAEIKYQSSNVPYVTASYSLDNGTTWHVFSNATISPIEWTVPDSGTTQGKFRLTDDQGQNIAVEKGNFTIIQSTRSLKLVQPTSNTVAVINQLLPITWTKQGFDTVRIDYSINGGLTWTTIIPKFSGDTVYKWLVPGPASTKAEVEIYPVGVSDVSPVTSEQFTISTGASSVNPAASGTFQILSTYPNPVEGAASATVHFEVGGTAMVQCELLDVLGKQVYSEVRYCSGDSNITFQTSSLPAGNYIVRLTSNGESVSRSLQIRR